MVKYSLAWIASMHHRSQGRHDLWTAFIKEHLDAWHHHACHELYDDEPHATDFAPLDAYLAGLAEMESTQIGAVTPEWVLHPCRFLQKPFFVSQLPSLRCEALLYTPTSLRRRMVFTGFVDV